MTKDEMLIVLEHRLTSLRWWLNSQLAKSNEAITPYVTGMVDAVRIEIHFLADLIEVGKSEVAANLSELKPVATQLREARIKYGIGYDDEIT